MKSIKPSSLLENLLSPPASSAGEPGIYAALKHTLNQRGLLDKQPRYYIKRIALLCILFGISLCFLFMVPLWWLQLLNAVFLAFVWTQIGLLSHEAGHRQMFHHTWQHELVSLIGGTLIIGMSYGWWLKKHNAHHSHPNQVDTDPDLNIPFLEFTGTIDLASMNAFRRMIVKYQAWFFLPALLTVALSLQYNGFHFLLKNKTKYQVLEWILMITHVILYLTCVFWLLGWWPALLFVLLHQTLTGFYLGAIFAPNHKGMPILEKENQMDFLYRQILTSRNIRAHPVTDFWYGGLNYQIEHHLFPGMARNQLKAAQPIVKAFCKAHAIPYHETTAWQSLHEILSHLYQIGAPLRAKTVNTQY
jgi:fatty acid desaturase